MSRNIVIVGNWKMNKTPIEAKAFMVEFKELLEANKDKIESNVKYGVGAPSVSLTTVVENATPGFMVAAENMNENESGAFTGELSAEMIKSTGANSVILGHSERRAMFNETSEAVAKKAIVAIKKGLTPIIAFGETLEQYEAGETKAVVEKMVKESTQGVDLSKAVLAYEPVWAIGTGKTATADDAQSMCKFIRSITQEDVIIQYGGSVKPENIAELMSKEDIDGALVGGAALEAGSFIKLLTLNK
ncbi:MAG: triose-phosphate isomerase [Mycoplasmataceae bacterium]|nr:triose-phosphate isomerase [Mycoplasmataceae bacterium]